MAETVYQPIAGTYEIGDSARFVHSNARNSTASWKPYQYTGDPGYLYDTAYLYRRQSNQLNHVWRLVQSFNANNQLVLREEHQYDKNAQVYNVIDRHRFIYNTTGVVDTYHTEIYSNITNIWTPNFRTTYVYDANGRLIEKQVHRWVAVPGNWYFNACDSFWYDANSNLVASKSKKWNYNTLLLEDSSFHHYTYNSNNLLIADTTFDADSINKDVKGYLYDLNSRLVKDSSVVWVNPTLGWANNGKNEYVYDVNNDLVLTNVFTWDKPNSIYVHTAKNYNQYNSTHQLTKQYTESWINGVWTNTSNYRVLHYGIVNSVIDIRQSSKGLCIYPVPATAYVNIDVAFEGPTDVSGIIFDMEGRVVKQFSDKAQLLFHKILNILDLPVGQYVMSINPHNGTPLIKSFTVIR